MHRLVIVLICALGLVTPVAAQPISQRAFTQELAAALRAQAPGLTVTITRDLQLELKDATGKTSTAFLDNAYTEYSANPKARAEVIQKYVQSFLESRKDGAPVNRARIVPVIKDRPWLAAVRESLKARGAKEPLESVFEDLNEDLIIVYAEDSPRNIRYLTPKDLTELGLRKDQLRSIAVANLRTLLPKAEVRPGPLVSMITAGGDYEASLLLFDDLWSDGQLAADGDVVVAVPARDLLLFTGSKNKAGIAKLRELASKFAREASYRLTDRLFVYRDGRFQRFKQ